MKSVYRARRTTALSWAAIGEVLLLCVLFLWHISQQTESALIVFLVVLGAFFTAVGAAVIMIASRSGTGLKLVAALLVATVSSGITVFAIVQLIVESGTKKGIGLLLLMAAFGMGVIAVHITRTYATHPLWSALWRLAARSVLKSGGKSSLDSGQR